MDYGLFAALSFVSFVSFVAFDSVTRARDFGRVPLKKRTAFASAFDEANQRYRPLNSAKQPRGGLHCHHRVTAVVWG